MDFYDKLEADLEAKLNKIYDERAALIKMNNINMGNEKEVLKTLFMSNVMKAKHRNESLRRDIDSLIQQIEYDVNKKSENEKQFSKLEKNYWAMVHSVYPEWQSELKDYKQKRIAKREIQIYKSNQEPKQKTISTLPTLSEQIESSQSQRTRKQRSQKN